MKNTEAGSREQGARRDGGHNGSKRQEAHASPRGRAALVYAEQFGFAVFPCYEIVHGDCACPSWSDTREEGRCEHAGKHPRTLHGFKDATRDPTVIRAWWARWPDAHVGIATGTPSGLFVLDVDPRHGGDDSLAALTAEHGPLPETPIVLTGGGGRHFDFRRPAGDHVPSALDPIRFPGIDIKCDGGYVIAPPSGHESGRSYAWELSAHLRDLALADPPRWLLDLQANRRSDRLRRDGTPLVIPDGTRNWTLYRLGCAFRRYGFDAETICECLLAVNARHCRPPLDGNEVATIARSAGRYDPATDPFPASPAFPAGDIETERDALIAAALGVEVGS